MGEPLDFQELIPCHSSPTGPHPIFKDGPVVGVDKDEWVEMSYQRWFKKLL